MKFHSINNRPDGWNFLYQNLEIKDYRYGLEPKGEGIRIPYGLTIFLQIIFNK